MTKKAIFIFLTLFFSLAAFAQEPAATKSPTNDPDPSLYFVFEYELFNTSFMGVNINIDVADCSTDTLTLNLFVASKKDVKKFSKSNETNLKEEIKVGQKTLPCTSQYVQFHVDMTKEMKKMKHLCFRPELKKISNGTETYASDYGYSCIDRPKGL